MALLRFTTVKHLMEECLLDTNVTLVSERAVQQMSKELDAFMMRVLGKASRMARHANRKTIKVEDILIAMESLRGEF